MHYSATLSNTYACPNSKHWKIGVTENRTHKFYNISTSFFCRFNYAPYRRSENRAKMYLNIAIDRYASIKALGTIMHDILIISLPKLKSWTSPLYWLKSVSNAELKWVAVCWNACFSRPRTT